MISFTRAALLALVVSAMFAVFGDATELFGRRSPPAVTLGGLATFLGLALAFLGVRESDDPERRRLTRVAAAAWLVSILLVGVGNMSFAGAPLVRAVGGAVFQLAPVLAVWRLGARLPRYALAVAVAVLALSYLLGAVLEMLGERGVGVTLPGNLLLLAGYWMTLRTYRE